MKHEPLKEKTMAEITIAKGEKLRRLADAIAELIHNPITVRLSELWYAVEGEEDRKRLSPEDAKKFEAEDARYEKAKFRRSELKAAFQDARLCLMEDEAVFLERTIYSLPDFATYGRARLEYVEAGDLDRMNEIASRLQFRADRELIDQVDSRNEDVFVAEGGHFAIGREYRSLLDKDQKRTYETMPALGIAALRAFHRHALGYGNRKVLDDLIALDDGLKEYSGRRYVSQWFDFIEKNRRDILIHREAVKYWMEL